MGNMCFTPSRRQNADPHFGGRAACRDLFQALFHPLPAGICLHQSSPYIEDNRFHVAPERQPPVDDSASISWLFKTRSSVVPESQSDFQGDGEKCWPDVSYFKSAAREEEEAGRMKGPGPGS